MCTESRSDPQHRIGWAGCPESVIPALKSQRQEDQKLRFIFGYIEFETSQGHMRSCLKKEKDPEEVDTILGNTGSQRGAQTVTKNLGKSTAVFSVITRSDRGQDSTRYCWPPWRASPWAPGIFMSGIRVPALTRKRRKLSRAATTYHQQLSPGQLFLPRKTLKHGLIGMVSHSPFIFGTI